MRSPNPIRVYSKLQIRAASARGRGLAVAWQRRSGSRDCRFGRRLRRTRSGAAAPVSQPVRLRRAPVRLPACLRCRLRPLPPAARQRLRGWRSLAAGAAFALRPLPALCRGPARTRPRRADRPACATADPEEYSAWNITFHDWQIMRRRTIGSCAENWARRQSMVSTPLSSSSVSPSRMVLRSPSIRRKNARRMRYPKRVKAARATGR